MEKIKKIGYNVIFFWRQNPADLGFGGNSRQQQPYEQVR